MNALAVWAAVAAATSAVLVYVQAQVSDRVAFAVFVADRDTIVAAVAVSVLTLAAAVAATLLGLRAGWRHHHGEGDPWADRLATFAWVVGAALTALWVAGVVFAVLAPLSAGLGAAAGLAAAVGSLFAGTGLARRRWA